MQWQQRMDELQQRLHQALKQDQRHRLALLSTLAARITAVTPMHELRRMSQQHESLHRRLVHAVDALFGRHRQRLASTAASLHALSPLATLQRGYSITRRVRDGAVIQDEAAVTAGGQVETLLSRGRLRCEVISVSD